MSLYNVYVTKNKYNMKDNPCVRFAYFGSDGEPVYKNKKAFDTDKEAIAYAKEMNKRNIDKIIRKLVAYKCDKCHKWHVGRTYATLSEKERMKIKNG